MLLVALLLPITMNAQVKSYVQTNKVAKNFVKKDATPTQLVVKKATLKANPKADIPEGYASVTLTAGDVWEDGSGYQMLLDADATAYGTIIPETGPLSTSGDVPEATYAEFEYKIPENADGALTTANIVINNSVTILIPAGTYDWCITNPTAGDRMWIASENGTVGGRANDFEFVSGAGYEFVVSLGGQNDQVDLVVDDPTAPQIPTDLTVDGVSVDGTTATIEWVPGENNASWNLRWRPYVDPALASMLWDLPNPGYEDQIADFLVVDADGDGNNWGLAYTNDAQDDLCFVSSSYSGGALTPDNWLITPEVGLGGTLKFKAWQRSASFPDKIKVYVCTNPDWESVADFVEISDDIQPAGTTAEEYEIDLSDYEGTGVIAFRHYDCEDQWSIYVDDIEVIPENPVEIPDWTVVENVTSPYTLEGLMEDTEYEVQVQGVGADARVTDWTESVRFFTEAGGQQPIEEGYFLVGSFNDWNQTAEGGRLQFEANKIENVEFEAGAEFKVIAFDEAGTVWFGGVDDNNVGYFLLNNDLMGVAIQTVNPGANFRIEEAGAYNLELTLNRDGEPVLTVTKANPDAISTVGVDAKADNAYYNLMGVKFNGMPSAPGIYIHNGKKVIIK
jgi:hypothetical protein